MQMNRTIVDDDYRDKTDRDKRKDLEKRGGWMDDSLLRLLPSNSQADTRDEHKGME